MSVKKGIIAIALVLTAVETAGYVRYYSRRYSQDQPRSGIITWLAFPDDTLFAPLFTETSFDAIAEGMTIADVVARVGMPLRIVEATRFYPMREYAVVGDRAVLERETPREESMEMIVYHYSDRGPGRDNYYRRMVTFDPDGRVTGVAKSLYTD